ncbi:MAG: DNA polymerase III subunit delta, partial [Gammaproteobacteria bacterium]
MLVKPERLASVLARPAPPAFFLVWGEEPLQRMESVDAIRAAVRAAGVDERLVFDAAVGLDWAAIEAEAGSLSLFASKRLIEIHLGAKKPDKQGVATLKKLTALAGEDAWLVTADALGREEQASDWYRAIDGRGAVVACRLLEGQAFRDWLAARAQARGRRLAPEAVEVLALRAEGNLLAAAQEVDKLVLLVDTPTVEAEQALAAVADSTRYDQFKLVDAALAGEAPRTLLRIPRIPAEGVVPVLLSWLGIR